MFLNYLGIGLELSLDTVIISELALGFVLPNDIGLGFDLAFGYLEGGAKQLAALLAFVELLHETVGVGNEIVVPNVGVVHWLVG